VLSLFVKQSISVFSVNVTYIYGRSDSSLK